MEDVRVVVRRDRGLRIARAKRVKTVGPVWIVPSESHSGSYVVNAQDESPTCTCPDFELRRTACKHVFAVEFVRHRISPDGTPVTETLRITYSQDWPNYNAAQVHEKELVQVLLKELCQGVPSPEQRRGRPRIPLSEAIFAATMKVYTTFSGRRASTDIRECEKQGMIDHAPHYNSIFNYLEKPELTPVLKNLIEVSAAPLKVVETNFAVDATGFSTSVYSRWYDQKYGRHRRAAQWLKAHAMVGVKTNVVTSIEVTPGDIHDSPQFADLVQRTGQNFKIAEVSADKAYLARSNLDAVELAGGVPYVPLKLNSQPKAHEAWQRLWHLYNYRKAEFLTHYHQRSNVESTFSAIKRKFGGNLRSKKYDSQRNELLCKILAYNLTCVVHSIYELGIAPEFSVEAK